MKPRPPDVAISPDAASLTAVLSTCYQATLLREEGHPVTFRLALSDPEAFEAAGGPPSGFHQLVFIRRLPLDAHELRRLSPAAVFSRSRRLFVERTRFGRLPPSEPNTRSSKEAWSTTGCFAGGPRTQARWPPTAMNDRHPGIRRK
jgi:hypothetical protein